MDLLALIASLSEQRAEKRTALDAILEAPTAENRSPNAEEDAAFTALSTEIRALDTRITELRDQHERDTAAAEARAQVPVVQVTHEPLTYGKGSKRSFFADVFQASRGGDQDAQTRLRRHDEEQRGEVERRTAKALSEAREMGIEIEKRDLTRTDTAGGGFVPPLHLIDMYAEMTRASRVHLDAYNLRPLPPGTDSINIPRITTGTSAAIQTADNAAVSETDIVEATLAVPVRTIAGQQDVAIQLLDQSPIAFDEVIFSDLMRAYGAAADAQTISGAGTGGTVLGILNVVGINAVTYTDATPTLGELYPKVADGVQQIGTNRFMPAEKIFMHPRRWGWMLAAVDTQNRPLVVPNSSNPMNASGVGNGGGFAEGPVGTLLGLPVYLDANIPTNLGAGTNEDRIIISRYSDHWAWESAVRTRVLPDVGSGTLTVRLQLYAYLAATAGRFPSATSVISGTGLVSPTF